MKYQVNTPFHNIDNSAIVVVTDDCTDISDEFRIKQQVLLALTMAMHLTSLLMIVLLVVW